MGAGSGYGGMYAGPGKGVQLVTVPALLKRTALAIGIVLLAVPMVVRVTRSISNRHPISQHGNINRPCHRT